MKFVLNFRTLRKKTRISPFVSIYTNNVQKSINISSDSGRVCRPLIIVENGKSLVTEYEITQVVNGVKSFEDLVQQGLIEYLDVNEEGDMLIAVYDDEIAYNPEEPNVIKEMLLKNIPYIKKNTTHLEIAPFTVLVCWL